VSAEFIAAVKKGDRETVEWMLAADPALVGAKDDAGVSAVLLAHYYGKDDVAKVLIEHGADVTMASKPAGFTPLHSAVADDAGEATKDLVRMLLDAGADPNARSATDGTPVHTAAFTGNIPVLQMLLAYGGDPAAADKKGLTPLDVARERHHSEVAALLHHSVTNRKRG